MADRKVKVIKAVGPRISTQKLEKASAQLLLSRVRGSEPKISFTFIQRLIDEVIRRRRDEKREAAAITKLSEEFDSDDYADLFKSDEDLKIPDEAWNASESFDLTTLEFTDLDPIREESEEEEADEQDEKEETIIPLPKKRAVVVCKRSKRRFWQGEINVYRVLTVSVLIFFIMLGGLLFTGCSDHEPPTQLPAPLNPIGSGAR